MTKRIKFLKPRYAGRWYDLSPYLRPYKKRQPSRTALVQQIQRLQFEMLTGPRATRPMVVEHADMKRALERIASSNPMPTKKGYYRGRVVDGIKHTAQRALSRLA